MPHNQRVGVRIRAGGYALILDNLGIATKNNKQDNLILGEIMFGSFLQKF